MKRIEKGTICLVISDCIVDDMGVSRNLKGHLVYGPGVIAPNPHFLGIGYEGYISLDDRPKIVKIDPSKLNKSLSSAYRKSKFLGIVNPFLEVLLQQLREDYKRYAANFSEYLAQENQGAST